MKSLLCAVMIAASLSGPLPALAADVVHPALIDKADVAGAIFRRPNTVTHEKGGNKVQDTVTLMTADKKYETGMYYSGPSHFERKGEKTYGVDEFMYFIDGSVTLTSLDGAAITVHAGEAVTIPHDWQGTWDTKGYTKFYAIYALKGNVDQ